MNWKHAYIRKTTEEEKDFYNSDEIWGGELPNVDRRILVYKDGYFNIDEWSCDNEGFYLIENNDYDDFYWCELEKPEQLSAREQILINAKKIADMFNGG